MGGAPAGDGTAHANQLGEWREPFAEASGCPCGQRPVRGWVGAFDVVVVAVLKAGTHRFARPR